MPRFERTNAAIFVYTYKEGPLAGLGHDLRLRVTRCLIEISEDLSEIRAEVEPSLEVDAAWSRQGRFHQLSPKEKRAIEQAIRTEVLVFREPISFASSSILIEGGSARIEGTLTLAGVTSSIALSAQKEVAAQGLERSLDRWQARFPLLLTDFGLRPYRAALGALRVKNQIEIEVKV
ncbi:MAG: YceI family protein [Myxococcota bacterium]